MPEFGLGCRAEFQLDHSVAQLNHGSFGATPLIVRDAAEAWRRRMEADPTQAYNQDDATGFIRLNGLRLKVAAGVHGS
jgi:hypothetical protein